MSATGSGGSGTGGSGSGGVVVAKIGTSSITDEMGAIDAAAVEKFCAGVAELRRLGRRVVVVTSGAIAAGLPSLGLGGANRPRDEVTLQAVSAIGQIRLAQVYEQCFAAQGLVCGQVLLAPLDFMLREQYLHARGTLQRLLELGVVPVVNENDATADDEIRFGDNDRLAALVAHLVGAELLVLLTDTPGLFTADPHLDASASLVEEVSALDRELVVGGSSTRRGSGGMASKLAAARMAAWSGVRAVIAGADRPRVLVDAAAGAARVGTVVAPLDHHLSARKLWIAFAVAATGSVRVDAGARRALEDQKRSLLPAGVTAVEGDFGVGEAVEVLGPDGAVFAKGLVQLSGADLARAAGHRTGELPDGLAGEAIHRDDLVVLPTP